MCLGVVDFCAVDSYTIDSYTVNPFAIGPFNRNEYNTREAYVLLSPSYVSLRARVLPPLNIGSLGSFGLLRSSFR
jgi:hypothetical protein